MALCTAVDGRDITWRFILSRRPVPPSILVVGVWLGVVLQGRVLRLSRVHGGQDIICREIRSWCGKNRCHNTFGIEKYSGR